MKRQKHEACEGYTLISKACEGYTLIEVLIVIVVFAFISLIATQTIILTLKATKKADSVYKVRQNLDYAIGVMERQLRGARTITSTCDGTAQSQITFIDQNMNPVTFSCVGVNSNNLPSNIASSSASLTSSDITISACSFTCIQGGASTAPTVTISATAKDALGQNSPVSEITQITLRTY